MNDGRLQHTKHKSLKMSLIAHPSAYGFGQRQRDERKPAVRPKPKKK